MLPPLEDETSTSATDSDCSSPECADLEGGLLQIRLGEDSDPTEENVWESESERGEDVRGKAKNKKGFPKAEDIVIVDQVNQQLSREKAQGFLVGFEAPTPERKSSLKSLEATPSGSPSRPRKKSTSIKKQPKQMTLPRNLSGGVNVDFSNKFKRMVESNDEGSPLRLSESSGVGPTKSTSFSADTVDNGSDYASGVLLSVRDALPMLPRREEERKDWVELLGKLLGKLGEEISKTPRRKMHLVGAASAMVVESPRGREANMLVEEYMLNGMKFEQALRKVVEELRYSSSYTSPVSSPINPPLPLLSASVARKVGDGDKMGDGGDRPGAEERDCKENGFDVTIQEYLDITLGRHDLSDVDTDSPRVTFLRAEKKKQLKSLYDIALSRSRLLTLWPPLPPPLYSSLINVTPTFPFMPRSLLTSCCQSTRRSSLNDLSDGKKDAAAAAAERKNRFKGVSSTGVMGEKSGGGGGIGGFGNSLLSPKERKKMEKEKAKKEREASKGAQRKEKKVGPKLGKGVDGEEAKAQHVAERYGLTAFERHAHEDALSLLSSLRPAQYKSLLEAFHAYLAQLNPEQRICSSVSSPSILPPSSTLTVSKLGTADEELADAASGIRFKYLEGSTRVELPHPLLKEKLASPARPQQALELLRESCPDSGELSPTFSHTRSAPLSSDSLSPPLKSEPAEASAVSASDEGKKEKERRELLRKVVPRNTTFSLADFIAAPTSVTFTSMTIREVVEDLARVSYALCLFERGKHQRALEGLNMLGQLDCEDAETVARFFNRCKCLGRTSLGIYLTEGVPFQLQVLKHFLELQSFGGMDFEVALRKMLKTLSLPGEGQRIDRLLKEFGWLYYRQNHKLPCGAVFKNQKSCHSFSFALIMLNTDAHSPNVVHKMSFEQFVENLVGYNDGDNYPRQFLRNMYDRIVQSEIVDCSTATSFTEESEEWFPDAVKMGYVKVEEQNVNTYKSVGGWKRRYLLVANEALYICKREGGQELHRISLRDVLVTPLSREEAKGRKFCFLVHSLPAAPVQQRFMFAEKNAEAVFQWLSAVESERKQRVVGIPY